MNKELNLKGLIEDNRIVYVDFENCEPLPLSFPKEELTGEQWVKDKIINMGDVIKVLGLGRGGK